VRTIVKEQTHLQIDKVVDTFDELGMGQDAPTAEKRPALKPKNVYIGGRKSQLKANRVASLTHGKRKRDSEGKGRGTYPLSCAAYARKRSQHRI
jgi:hypothetical protein